jgi:demethylmenaquinone methyltransferase/2-methoxy-6-polyprenyl-1,4-benzoquinol methylase
MAGKTPSETTHFGFRTVAADAKQGLVDRVFTHVADRYDLMNDLMSGGLHRMWKDIAVTWLNPPTGARSFHLLDVAGGTGDIALRVLEAGGAGARVTVFDISARMLAAGAGKVEEAGESGRVRFVQGNGEALPFPDESFDAYTIGFGIRNFSDIPAALGEAFRVLRPGGRFLCLEFSHVTVPMLDRLYDLYSFNAIPALGGVVTGDADAYRYLVESIRRFPDQEAFADLIEEAGFARVQHRDLSGGIVAIHSAWRI